MRIISKFKDYYDGGAVYGIDMERVYVRKTEDIEIEDTFVHSGSEWEIIGFCGEIFPICNESHNIGISEHWIRHPKQWVLYGEDAISYEFKDSGVDRYKKIKYDPDKRGWSGQSRRHQFFILKENLEEQY